MGNDGAERQQLRLALVLNGGVSLAVWMGGVVHEIDQLRRAARPTKEEAAQRSGTYGYWWEMCEARNVRVLVDVVAGTSAGGLNGALLASAIAAGPQLPEDLRTLWIKEAALTGDKLLRRENPPESLLSGAFLEEQIMTVTRHVGNGPPNGTPVTLFITATALGGLPSRGTDSAGGRFAIDDHRRLYRFAYDPGRYHFDEACGLRPDPENDFDHDGRIALVRAARASASFPLAFAPVSEEPLVAEAHDGRRYRATPKAPAVDQPATYLMDGGVLDNAPFGPVLKEISRRPLTGPYRRVIGYIVPSSGLPDIGHRTASRAAGPVRWTDVLVRALNLPREVDFRDDIDTMDTTLATSAESAPRRLYLRLCADQDGERGPLLATAEALLEEYRRARAVAAVWEVRRILSKRPMRVSLLPPPAIDAVAVLNKATRRWLPPAGIDVRDPLGDEWCWGISVAEHVVLMMLRDVRDELNRSPLHSATGPRFADPHKVATALNEALAKIRAVDEAVRRALVARTTLLDNSPETCPGETHAALLDDVFANLAVGATLRDLVHGAAQAYAGDDATALGAAEVMTYALASEVLSRSFADPAAPRPSPPIEFVRFGPDVPSPHPGLADYRLDGGQKLYGTKVRHFGAFAVSAAREDDWLWGRLDAVAHLTRLVMAASSSPEEIDEMIVRGQRAVLDEEAKIRGLSGGEHLARHLKRRRAQVTAPDGELVAAFFKTAEGKTTATELGRSATHLLTRGGLRTQDDGSGSPKAWQRLVEALVAEEPPEHAAAFNRLLRWFTRPLRRDLWHTLRTEPAALVPRMTRSVRRWAATRLAQAVVIGLGMGLILASAAAALVSAMR
jgi:predicted acylesterase/phospholipase RssA